MNQRNYSLLFRAARDILDQIPKCERCNGTGSLGPCECLDCNGRGYVITRYIRERREQLEHVLRQIVEE
jgi:hypothetical protein